MMLKILINGMFTYFNAWKVERGREYSSLLPLENVKEFSVEK